MKEENAAVLRASADDTADIRAELRAMKEENADLVARLKDENAALAARMRILEGVVLGQGTPSSESNHGGGGTQAQLTEKSAEAQGRRRLTDSRSGKITYDGSQFIITGPVLIQGSLNVTGIVTDTTPVVSTTSDFVGFTANKIGFSLTALGSWSTLDDWTVQNSAGIENINTYGTDGFDTTTGIFTAPVDGVYFCRGSAQVYTETLVSVCFRITTSVGNGATNQNPCVMGGPENVNGPASKMISVAATLSLSASESAFIEWQVWQDTQEFGFQYFTCFMVHES